MNFHERLRFGGGEFRHAPRLRARLVLGQQAAGGQEITGSPARVSRPGRDARRDGNGARPSSVANRVSRTDARRARDGRRFRAGPEYAVLGGDPLVADAGIVGGPAAGRGAQFGETSRGSRAEMRFRPRGDRPAPSGSRRSVQTPSGGGVARRRNSTRPSRLVMVPSSSAHCATGSTTSASAAVSDRNEVGHHQEIEVSQPARQVRQHRARRPAMLEAITSSPRTASAERGRATPSADRPGARQARPATPQTAATCRAMRWVVEFAIARKLVGLLPVLAAALAVALPGQAAIAAVAACPALPERERQVDEGKHVVDAVALLLGPAPSAPWRCSLRPARRAAWTSWRSGTPVMRSTRSGQ